MRNDGQKIINAILDRYNIDRQYTLVNGSSNSELGMFSNRRGIIRVNQHIIDDDSWLDTLLHEIAHLLDLYFNGSHGHDKTFMNVCRELRCNADSSTLCELDYTGKYTVSCRCAKRQKDRLSTHKRWLYESGLFSCGKCGDKLTIRQNR